MNNQLSEIPSTGANQRRIRPTIGFFTPQFRREWDLLPWQGIVDAAREHDVNIVTYVGRAVGWNSIEAQANILYDLAKDSRLDGLIFWKGALTVCLSETEVEKFCKQYDIPVVTLEGRINGLTCVSYENYQGMRSAVEHLIDVHGYKKIGFLGMYEHHMGFQERYRGYVDAMTAHGLPIDPRLAKPWFPYDKIFSGTIDERVLATYLEEASSLGMEAVIGIADSIALQVRRTLQERGARVPEDIAVVGFDGLAEGRVLTPPLTTVEPSWYEFGHLAAETLIDLLAGKPVPEVVNVPTVLMVRQSCGCQDPCVAAVTAESSPTPATPAFTYPEIAPAMIQAALVNETEGIRREMESLFNTLVAELTGEKTGGFLNALSDALQRSTATMDELSYWHNALSALRQQILPWLKHNGQETGRAETLLQQAQVLIGRVAERAQMLKSFQGTQQENAFQQVGLSLITTLNVDALMHTLADQLPGQGIPSGYLSLFENPQPYHYPDPAPEWARLILAYNPQGRIPLELAGQHFPSRQLIPDEFWPQDRVCSFVLLSLHFQEDQIGFVLFESGSRKGRIYETLSTQISSALKGALLLQAREKAETALERAYSEVEHQVKERTAQLQHEIAERERLQQEVIESQQRVIQELSTPVIPALEGVIIMPLIGSIDSLRARDITRALLAGISQHQAKVVILDVTGVPLVDSGIANHLHKTIQAARLKGARTIITGISEAVAESIVDLGIDWSHIETMTDLQTGLRAALVGQKRRS